MQKRIDRLRADIQRLRETAANCDADIQKQFLALADEMQIAIEEMQQLNDEASPQSKTIAPDHGQYMDALNDEHPSACHKATSKLLLVDDEDPLRRLLAEFFSEEGFDVVQASNCTIALAQFDQHPDINCVLSDVRMPDGNGMELATQLLERKPNAKIALISGFSDQLPKSLAERGVHLFRKPLPLADLAMHVKELCAA